MDSWGPSQINTPPAVAPAGRGRIYFDKITNKFKISMNGGAWKDLGASVPLVLTQESPNDIPLKIVAPDLAGGGTAPDAIGGTIVAWWDFSDITTLFKDTARTDPATASGDLIKGVTDKSGNAFHLSEATNPPTFRTAPSPSINGKACLEFDGVNDKLLSTNTKALVTRTNSITAFVVLLHDTAFSAEGGGWNPGNTAVACSRYLAAGSNFGGVQNYITHNSTTGTAILARRQGNEDLWHITTHILASNGAADPSWNGQAYTGVDDTRTASLTSANATGNLSAATAVFAVGTNGVGSFPWNGYIAEIVIFEPTLNEDARKQVETWLAVKYGKTLPYSISQFGNVDLIRVEDDSGNAIFRVSNVGDVYVGASKLNVP
jgi:hypothetical protein